MGNEARNAYPATEQRSREQIFKMLRDADVMLNAGQDVSAVLQAPGLSEASYLGSRNEYRGMKAAEVGRLGLEEANKGLKEVVADMRSTNGW